MIALCFPSSLQFGFLSVLTAGDVAPNSSASSRRLCIGRMSEVEELEINLRVDGLCGTRRALSIATWKWISRAGNPRYTVKVKYNALLVESERSTAGKAAVPPGEYVLDKSAALPSAIVEL